MERFVIMLNTQLTLIVFIGFGMLLYHHNVINDKNRHNFMTMVISYLLPVMTFNSFKEVTMELLTWSGMAILIGFGIYTFYLIVGLFAYRWMPESKSRVARYATLVNNVAFAGLPLVSLTYGDPGAVIVSVFLIPHRLFMWILGIHILANDKKTHIKENLIRLLKNPAIIAVFLGLLRGILEIELPEFIDRSLGMLSSTVSPMAMIMVGSVVAKYPLRGVINKESLWYCFIRLIFIPIIVLFSLRLLHFPDTLVGIITILSSMPAGTPTALMASQYGWDGEYGANLTFLSIILSVFTTPLIMLLL